jgi:tRNA 2-thiouridine synthesizing protein B
MSILYILHRSPYSAPEMESTLKLAKPGDGIVLMQDAVLALRSAPRVIDIGGKSLSEVRLYALKADMEARSIQPNRLIEVIDYDRLIELLGKYDSTFS